MFSGVKPELARAELAYLGVLEKNGSVFEAVQSVSRVVGSMFYACMEMSDPARRELVARGIFAGINIELDKTGYSEYVDFLPTDEDLIPMVSAIVAPEVVKGAEGILKGAADGS